MKIVLAHSGGFDTPALLSWIKENTPPSLSFESK
jgi:argininosuccinate synthase